MKAFGNIWGAGLVASSEPHQTIQKGRTAVTIPQPPPGGGRRPGRRDLLFTPGPRLGWIFRDRRSLLSPYPEPQPDPALIRQHAAARLAAAQRSCQQAKKWAARPSLIIAVAIVALAGCAHAVSPTTSLGPAVLGAIVLAGPGQSRRPRLALPRSIRSVGPAGRRS
jgi:MYXO-CTERM domain-containing protein